MTIDEAVKLMRQAYEALYFAKTQEVFDWSKVKEPIDKNEPSVWDLCLTSMAALEHALQEHDALEIQAKSVVEVSWKPNKQTTEIGHRVATIWQQKPWRWKVEAFGCIQEKGECDSEDQAKAEALKAARSGL